jgi:hypothetical protein
MVRSTIRPSRSGAFSAGSDSCRAEARTVTQTSQPTSLMKATIPIAVAVLEAGPRTFGRVRPWPCRIRNTHRQGDSVRGEPGAVAK